jgi:hypothetical protein
LITSKDTKDKHTQTWVNLISIRWYWNLEQWLSESAEALFAEFDRPRNHIPPNVQLLDQFWKLQPITGWFFAAFNANRLAGMLCGFFSVKRKLFWLSFAFQQLFFKCHRPRFPFHSSEA